MKAKKLREQTNPLLKTLWILGFVVLAVSCDVLESDPDVLEPRTDFTGKEIFVMANSASIIDLNTALQSNVPARIALTSEARYGSITDLGEGILQYSPSVGDSRARDDFEFTVYAANNEIIKRDTVVIIIENDSTKLPCNIYPIPDYVHGVDRDPVIIDVTENDIICGGNVIVSVFKPKNSFPPKFGQAVVVDNMIKYTPGSNFDGVDKIMYKLTSAADSSKTAYGLVYISGDSACTFRLANDHYVFSEQAIDSLLTLPVFQNDSLCNSLNQHQVNLKTAPLYGQAAPAANGFTYRIPAIEILPLNDYFTYEVCIDGVCKTARVDVKFKKDSSTVCTVRARPDSVNISNIDSARVNINVLKNDSTCGILKSMRITRQPQYGEAFISDQIVIYVGNEQQRQDDTLKYEICNGGGCSEAQVSIKRKK